MATVLISWTSSASRSPRTGSAPKKARYTVVFDDSRSLTVTANPARALSLGDRGTIAEGKRADLVLAHRKGDHIHIDHVWRQGKRVF